MRTSPCTGKIYPDSRPGYSLVELVVAVGASTVLMAGMASALLVSNHALDIPENLDGQRLNAADAQQDLLADIQHALAFTERTARAVTFLVPDRDGDGDPETVRYAWGGTPGQPLTYEYNGGSPINLADDVHQFDLSYLTTTLVAPVIPEDAGQGGGNLVFVSGGDVVQPSWLAELAGQTASVSLTSGEESFVKQFSSWGYEVTAISPAMDSSTIQKAMAEADVIYVSSEPGSSKASPYLTGTAVGIVSAQAALTADLGFSSKIEEQKGNSLLIVDDQHHVASDFTLKQTVSVSQKNVAMNCLAGTITSGLSNVGAVNDTSVAGLVTLNAGMEDFNGRKVPGRRVQVPWGFPGIEQSSLTGNGLTLLQRSLEWAAGAGDDGLGGGGGGYIDPPILIDPPIIITPPILISPLPVEAI